MGLSKFKWVFFVLNVLLLFVFSSSTIKSQTDLNLEFQVYPTGFIPAFSIDKHYGDSNIFHARIGGNFFDHRDLGEKESEKGSGYGFSLGYKRYFKPTQKGFRLGIKNDVWWNKVDWTDANQFGETKIIVLQPTAELSYVWQLKNTIVAPSLAFGMEWNVKTEGDPTGQGAILLLGIQIGKRFGGVTDL